MIQKFLAQAKQGESVYLCDMRAAFAASDSAIDCVIKPPVGETRRWRIPLPQPNGTEEETFVREYFYANIYNLISTLGGAEMTLYIPDNQPHITALCETLDDVFQTALPRATRSGYGKCLNVTDRVNQAMGFTPFRFRIVHGQCPELPQTETQTADAVSEFRKAVTNAADQTLCGMDIGGTDIKIVGTVNGRIQAYKEYDWRPADMTHISQLIDPILLLTEVMQAALTLPDTPHGNELRALLLDKDATDADMRRALDRAEAYDNWILFDGIGVNFPDVVIQNKIVGGETLKTRGIRDVSPDYEAEFTEIGGLADMLLAHCKPAGKVHMANDGSLAAYAGAVELAHSDRADEVAEGVFAHTLGTELGTGWIDEAGQIPQIPLEVYNCIIDLGNHPAREYDVNDLRSVRNFNTGISGTLQKYASQSGAYRLALTYFTQEQVQELYDKGFIEERNGGVYVTLEPKDMRKALLEHIMELADTGNPQAQRIFHQIGKYLAATWQETEFILNPAAKRRVLFGRFVKRQICFELMQAGAHERSRITLDPGDDSLAFTPLMHDLKANPAFTVAQFGQAVGAAYFVASIL